MSEFLIKKRIKIEFYAIFFLCILILQFYPLYNQFYAWDDYAIYIYFSEAVSKGYNPYSLPSFYRSESVPKFFSIGWTQYKPGVVRQECATHPPLLWVIYSFIFRLHNIKGLYWFFISIYGVSIVLCLFLFEQEKVDSTNTLFFLIFYALNPLFTVVWFHPIDDKALFAFFLFLILIFRKNPYLETVVLSLFSGLKGLGIPVMMFYLLHMVPYKKLKPKQVFCLIMIFVLILICAHLFWFPEWINGYKWRFERQNFVGHNSLFVPFSKIGLYNKWLPKILTILSFALLLLFTLKKRVTLKESLLLPIVFSIIFNTEAGYDRLLVANLALILLTPAVRIILVSYAIGCVF